MLKLYDEMLHAPAGSNYQTLKHIFEADIDLTIGNPPKVSRDALKAAVKARYPAWVRAQKKTTTIPPKAQEQGLECYADSGIKAKEVLVCGI